MMLLNDFDYLLPPELIAQNPLEQRDASRLMLLDRRTGAIGESIFHDIPQMFRKGDLLVINDTRVIPARLKGFKDSGGKVEVFLVRKLAGPGETWRCLVKASKPPKPDSMLFFPEGLEGRIVCPEGNGSWQISFLPTDDFEERLERGGMVPLPPYIRRQAGEGDKDRYQTVFARQKGAVAAPTAGLHMTSGLLGDMERIGGGGA